MACCDSHDAHIEEENVILPRSQVFLKFSKWDKGEWKSRVVDEDVWRPSDNKSGIRGYLGAGLYQ